MAQTHETGNPIVTADNLIHDILAAPLGPDWTVEALAEQMLDGIANQRTDGDEFALDANSITNRQVLRLIRPLLACLANKSAVETGAPVNLYGGHLSFKRAVSNGLVRIIGQFENRPGNVCVMLRRSCSPLDVSSANTGQAIAFSKATLGSDTPTPNIPLE